MDWRTEITRPALGLEVGGFRPTQNPTTSCFGEIRVQKPGEKWPYWRGIPLWPLCQFNLEEASFRPSLLEDLSMICVFIAPEYMQSDALIIDTKDTEPGWPWFARTYSSLKELVPVQENPNHNSPLLPFEARWHDAVSMDYPTHDTLPIAFDDLGIGDYYEQERIERLNQTKLGGWPSCIQSEPWWDYDTDGAEFEYVLQIDSGPKSNWMWGDCGAGYLARSKTNPNRWALDFQFT